MMFYNRQSLTFEREEDWGFRTTLSLKTEKNEAAGNLYFVPVSVPIGDMGSPPVGEGGFRTTELHAELRYAPGETYIHTKQQRIPLNLNAPVFTLSHTWGMKGVLGGEYNYNLTEASIFKRFWLNSWGKVDCMVKGGIQWNKVPFPLLIMPETNLSYIIQDYTFELINDMEFLNDRYASAIVSWDMGGKLLNRIPLIRKLKWREMLAVRCLWGDLTDKNNPTLATSSPRGGNDESLLMAFPESSHVMQPDKPYWEVAAGIHNILKVLHVEYVRRLNYNHLPTAHKHGIRFTLRLKF
jgi:hypothetical protein